MDSKNMTQKVVQKSVASRVPLQVCQDMLFTLALIRVKRQCCGVVCARYRRISDRNRHCRYTDTPLHSKLTTIPGE